MTARLQVGLCGLTYYTNQNPILNWFKTAALGSGGGPEIHATSAPGGVSFGAQAFTDGYVDADYNIANPTPSDVTSYSAVFNAAQAGSPPVTMANEPFTMTWTGTDVTLSISGATGTPSITQDSGSGGTATFLMANGNVSFTFTWKGGLGSRVSPPANIKIYQTRYATNIANGEILNPDWLDLCIRPFKRVRFMTWMDTNNGVITDYSDFATESYYRWGSETVDTTGALDGSGFERNYGTKSGIPLSVIAYIANECDIDVHVNIPHRATDACVTAMAAYFKANIAAPRKVIWEYSNEHWNGGFNQRKYMLNKANALGGTFSGNYSKWYGYRASQCMKLIRDEYADRTRWVGVLATQTISADGVTEAAKTGVDYWLANDNPGGYTYASLFDELAMTGYMGDTIPACYITAVGIGNNPSMSVIGDVTDGQEILISIPSGNGMPQLDGQYATISSKSFNSGTGIATFTATGINTTGYTAFTGGNAANIAYSNIFRLYEASVALHGSSPGSYPTDYTYINQQLAEATMHGTCSSGLFSMTANLADVDSLVNTQWPPQFAYAATMGLTPTQYEGGQSLYGATPLTAVPGGNHAGDILTDIMLNVEWSPEMAAAYDYNYAEWFALGGGTPSKFVIDGGGSRFGTWGALRYMPVVGDEEGDVNNPTYLAVLAANAGPTGAVTLTATW